MTTLEKIKSDLAEILSRASGAAISPDELVNPPQPELGDFSFPCFRLAKELKRAPAEIAKELAVKAAPPRLVEKVEAVGPYVNFYLSAGEIAADLFKEISKKDLGLKAFGKGKKIAIEFSQPNTHKDFHVGHLRGTTLGAALANLYEASGYQVKRINYIGDVGAHVAKCLWAFKKWHMKDKAPADRGAYLGKIYAEASQRAEEKTDYNEEIAEVQRKLEAGDKEWTALWQKTRTWSLANFKKVYQTLGVKFDYYFFESEVEKGGKKIAAELLSKGVAQKSQGAVIVDLSKYGLDVFLILKSDGASLYATKDLALAQAKMKKYRGAKNLIVTDSRQTFYFKQLFKTLEFMGIAEPFTHIPYEFVTLPGGAMASREGTAVTFTGLFALAKEKLEKETRSRHPDWPNKKISKVAEELALSGLKFDMLKVQPAQIITFDLNQALSFEGFTGPYLEYSLARINSVFKKTKQIPRRRGISPLRQAQGRNGKTDFSVLQNQAEKRLIFKLALFSEVAVEAQKRHDPSHLAKFLYELSQIFSDFYETCPILRADNEALKLARLQLAQSTRVVLTRGMDILGLPLVEEM